MRRLTSKRLFHSPHWIDCFIYRFDGRLRFYLPLTCAIRDCILVSAPKRERMIDDAPSKPVEPDPQTQPPPVPPPPDRPTSPNAEQVPSNDAEQRITSLEDRIRLGERWMIYLTGAIAFFGLCSVIVAFLQWQSMQGQLGELKTSGNQVERQVLLTGGQLIQAGKQTMTMQQQMQQDQRPWLHIIFNPPRTPDGRKIIQITENQPLTFQLRFTNLGKTPARSFDSGMFVEVVKNGSDPKLDATTIPPFRFTGGIMFPGDISDTWVTRGNKSKEDDSLTPREHQDLLSGKAYIAIYGTATYTDVF